MKLFKSKLREIIREEIQKLNEFQAGDRVKEMIEDGIHAMDDGFKSLRAGMLKAWESDIHDRSKINKELKNMNKEFDKIVKLIVKGLY
jgi:replicative DNA helicase